MGGSEYKQDSARKMKELDRRDGRDEGGFMGVLGGRGGGYLQHVDTTWNRGRGCLLLCLLGGGAPAPTPTRKASGEDPWVGSVLRNPPGP